MPGGRFRPEQHLPGRQADWLIADLLGTAFTEGKLMISKLSEVRRSELPAGVTL